MSNAARLTLCAIALAVVLLGLPTLILLGVGG